MALFSRTYKCFNCGAPIEGVVCPYCHSRNGIDLKQSFEVYENPDRTCPNCDIPLQTHLVDEEEQLYIERCDRCEGIFFDFGEMEAVMQREITPSERYNLRLLDQIKNNPLVREREIRYKKCPECGKIMQRINYQSRSGVIIDRCADHGYWLDAGELRQIMEWAKLEGVRDFTPMQHSPATPSSAPAAGPTGRYRAIDSAEWGFDPIVGFLRKLYGL